MLERVNDISPMLGCDPEFFFKHNGQIVGAETLIPKNGINYTPGNYKYDGAHTSGAGQSKFIIDGVQAELNPRPNTCRANLANEIAACFKTLKTELTKHKGYEVDFSRTVEISKDNLDKLSDDSKKFGCAPSKTIYNKQTTVNIANIDPCEYRTRAAGGHIHIGKAEYATLDRALHKDYEKTILMLDIICGNTAVLVDRDKGNIERRKVYGRAGEFRLPAHGLEYRTLSNFWLTSYPLMSFAFGMARLAVQLMADTKNETYFKAFTGAIETKNIYTAINENDYDMALKNFKAIEPLIMDVTNTIGDRYPISSANLHEFNHFHTMIEANGLSYWFKDDPMTHWTNLGEGHRGGFSDYLKEVVKLDMQKVANKKVA